MKQLCGSHNHRNNISYCRGGVFGVIKPGDLIAQATLFDRARPMSMRPNGTGSDPTFS